jgi:mono/diheme cytochrome c family protein
VRDRGGVSGRKAFPLAAVAALTPLLAPTAARATDPHTNYMLDCMGCHQANGAGVPGKVPDMRSVLPVLSGTVAGRRYLIEVPGVAQAPLSNAELANLINWMVHNLGDLTRQQHFTRFAPAEVAAYRQTPLVEVAATRQKVLQRRAPGNP